MTPTWYLGVVPVNEPHEVGLDDVGRALWECVFLLTKRPSDTVAAEAAAILQAAGIAVVPGGARAVIPSGPGPFVAVRIQGGAGQVGTHNDGPGAYRRPAVQVLVHAEDSAAAEVTSHAAYSAFVAVRNRQVVSA